MDEGEVAAGTAPPSSAAALGLDALGLDGLGFVDQWDHKIDAKGRLFLPADVRSAFFDGAMMAPGPERVLEIYPLAAFARRQRRLRARSTADAEQRRLLRFLHHSAHRTTPDAQGRIVLPSRLRDLAGLDREVVIAGVDDRLEVWDRERHRAEFAGYEGLWDLDEPTPEGQDAPW